MLIELSEVIFENDFFNVDLPNGSVFTSFDEYGNEEYMRCPCAIGLGNDILIIKTDYPEYEGKVLTSENMRFCKIEVYEQ